MLDPNLHDKLAEHLLLFGSHFSYSVIVGKWLATRISRRDSLRSDLSTLKEKQREDVETIEDRLQLLEERLRVERLNANQSVGSLLLILIQILFRD